MSISSTLNNNANVVFILIFVVYAFATEYSVPLLVRTGASVFELGEL